MSFRVLYVLGCMCCPAARTPPVRCVCASVGRVALIGMAIWRPPRRVRETREGARRGRNHGPTERATRRRRNTPEHAYTQERHGIKLARPRQGAGSGRRWQCYETEVRGGNESTSCVTSIFSLTGNPAGRLQRAPHKQRHLNWSVAWQQIVAANWRTCSSDSFLSHQHRRQEKAMSHQKDHRRHCKERLSNHFTVHS